MEEYRLDVFEFDLEFVDDVELELNENKLLILHSKIGKLTESIPIAWNYCLKELTT